MQSIAEKLGLPADADEAAILAKITEVMSQLEAMKGKDSEREADAIMNMYGERIPQKNRDDVRKRLITNRADTVAMLELLPDSPKKTEERIFNRETAKHPDAVSDADKASDTKKAAAIRNRASTIQREQGLPWNRAFGLAQAELS